MSAVGEFFIEQPNRNREELRTWIASWVNSSALKELVAVFGGRVPSGSLGVQLSALVEFSSVWDFRGGSERVQISLREDLEAKESELRPLFDQLGLSTPRAPRTKSYDQMVVLGGTLLSCRLRTEFAHELIAQHDIRCSSVSLLGTSRRALPEEYPALADAGINDLTNVTTEFEALSVSCVGCFQATPNGETEDENGLVREYVWREGSIRVLSTSPRRGEPRANTEDTYAHFSKAVGLTGEQSVLICTSQIYAPFQFFGAARMLAFPTGASVEVVGYPPQRASRSGSLQRVHNFLQEMRSALRAARILVDAI